MFEKKKQLEELKKELESKTGIISLLNTAEDVIFGEGNPDAMIFFIGEAGGYWEAKLRRPFVGNAGKLLDKLILSIGIKREDVYISNVVKARPPENRDPLPEEIEAFKTYLDREFEIIQPKVIVTLGRFAMAEFYPYGKISVDHGKGRIIEYNGQKYIFVPMFHPAAALRSGEVEKQLKQDFVKLPEEIERLKNPNLPIKENEEKSKDSNQIKNEQLELI
ncbi:uracil-DNA glycosylase [Patescibacteria group bacterium]|nr:uracil-DNA glycosylase [Patescibacteria group bacterium]